MADEYCAQPLRATIDPLHLTGPGPRVGVYRDGRPTSLILKRWPVLEVVSIQVAPNKMPYQWVTVPPSEYTIGYPIQGMYGSSAPPASGEGGQEVLLNPGWVRWDRGHNGYAVQVTYVNGWPHAGLPSAATPVTSGTQVIAVDDCSGWVITSPFTGEQTGATGTVYDAQNQEVIQVTAASAAQGPGTLTLASPLAYQHNPGVIVSTLPRSALMGIIWFCASVALTRGATATSNREVPASGVSTAGPKSPEDLAKTAKCLLDPYRRII